MKKIINKTNKFVKENFKKEKKIFFEMLFFKLFQVIVAFSNVFRGYNNATVG